MSPEVEKWDPGSLVDWYFHLYWFNQRDTISWQIQYLYSNNYGINSVRSSPHLITDDINAWFAMLWTIRNKTDGFAFQPFSRRFWWSSTLYARIGKSASDSETEKDITHFLRYVTDYAILCSVSLTRSRHLLVNTHCSTVGQQKRKSDIHKRVVLHLSLFTCPK